MQLDNIYRDIVIDRFGDIMLNGGDILTSSDKIEIAKNNSKHRIRSGKGDLIKYVLYGAGLEEFIGKPISETLTSTIQKRIEESLTEDGFIGSNNISIQTLTYENQIIIKLVIGSNLFQSSTKNQEVNISFDVISGRINVY